MSTAVAAGLLTALAVWTWPARRSAGRRLHRLRAGAAAGDGTAGSAAVSSDSTTRCGTTGSGRASSRTAGSGRAGSGRPSRAASDGASRARVMVAAPAGLAGFLVAGWPGGIMLGGLLAVGVLVVLHRREPARLRLRRARMTADLPFTVDLMVACLRAGLPLDRAVEAVSEAVAGPLGERLAQVAAKLRLGADATAAWAVLADEPWLAPLARTLVRAAHNGAPVADVLRRLADDARHAARADASAAARRVAVQAVAPLGLCFLPAFVFLGVIPLVAGLAAQLPLP